MPWSGNIQQFVVLHVAVPRNFEIRLLSAQVLVLCQALEYESFVLPMEADIMNKSDDRAVPQVVVEALTAAAVTALI